MCAGIYFRESAINVFRGHLIISRIVRSVRSDLVFLLNEKFTNK